MKTCSYLLLFMQLFIQTLQAQPVEGTSLDHRFLIEELSHSKDITYHAIVNKYDNYLEENPGDIKVHIERCKFIELAEYDYDEEYNPNQHEFDSCTAALMRLYPHNPDVLVYFISFSYGDERDEVFEKIKKSISDHPEEWSKSNLGLAYFQMADRSYDEKNYIQAEMYMNKACYNDDQYKGSIEYARILIELDKKPQAIRALTSTKDTVTESWHLSQKAALLMELGAHRQALKLYDSISARDSSYNNNEELAGVMTAIGKFDLARKYLVADTSKHWNKERALLSLFLHDLQYSNGVVALGSYNAFRNTGYARDALAIYRLKLFVAHPALSWKWNDIAGILSLLALIIILILLPSAWVLPVYFIGHKWKIAERANWENFNWGLKSFWLISFLYLLASVVALINTPDVLYSYFDANTFSGEINNAQRGFSILIFMVTLAASALILLFRVNLKIFIPRYDGISKNVFRAIGWFFLYKIFLGMYIRSGTKIFDVNMDELASVFDFVLASRTDIKAFLTNYGGSVTCLAVGLLVPVYEEIIFRGIILESTKRYVGFGLANTLQAALFASVHENLFMFPAFFLFGIMVGVLNNRSGSLLPGIVFHAVNNLLAISVFIYGNYSI